MRSRKQKKRTDTNSNLLESKGKQQQATATSQTNPMVQQVSQMGNAPNPSTHAAVLNRAPANQQSSNQQLLLQLQRKHGNGYVNQVLQLKRSKAKRGKGKENIKKGTKQHGADVSDVGGGSSGLSSAITESNEAGGMSGVLGLPAAGLDTVNAGKDVKKTYEAFKQNDDLKKKKAGKAAISSTKAGTGLAGAGAGMAGFAGDAVNETATNAVGGGAGIVTGGIDAAQGGRNVYKARVKIIKKLEM